MTSLKESFAVLPGWARCTTGEEVANIACAAAEAARAVVEGGGAGYRREMLAYLGQLHIASVALSLRELAQEVPIQGYAHLRERVAAAAVVAQFADPLDAACVELELLAKELSECASASTAAAQAVQAEQAAQAEQAVQAAAAEQADQEDAAIAELAELAELGGAAELVGIAELAKGVVDIA